MTTSTADPSEVPPWGQAPLFDVPDRARLRSVREIAHLANVHRNTVLSAIHAGRLTATRPGRHFRVALTDAEAWIRSSKTETEPAPGADSPGAGREDRDR